MTEEELKKRFTYHPPAEQKARIHHAVRCKGAEMAGYIDGACADSREKSLALTKLEECVMWANAAIAREE